MTFFSIKHKLKVLIKIGEVLLMQRLCEQGLK